MPTVDLQTLRSRSDIKSLEDMVLVTGDAPPEYNLRSFCSRSKVQVDADLCCEHWYLSPNSRGLIRTGSSNHEHVVLGPLPILLCKTFLTCGDRDWASIGTSLFSTRSVDYSASIEE
jgi:hypothetical protein